MAHAQISRNNLIDRTPDYISLPIDSNFGVSNPQQIGNVNSCYDYIRIAKISEDIDDILKEPNEISTGTPSKILNTSESGFIRILNTSKSDFILNILDKELSSLHASENTLGKTKDILTCLVEEIVENKLEWIDPITYTDDEKSVCVEWRRNDRHLYFDINERKTRYCKMWEVGEAFKTMPGNIINSELLDLWVWLLHEKE